jgi:hypothetical protein
LRGGISAERAKFYRDRISQKKYLAILKATEENLDRTQLILVERGI